MGKRYVQIGKVSFTGHDDLDCPYLGWIRIVPDNGYIDVPFEMTAEMPPVSLDTPPPNRVG